MTKTSGRKLQKVTVREGGHYRRVKKSLKKTITRISRRRLNRNLED